MCWGLIFFSSKPNLFPGFEIVTMNRAHCSVLDLQYFHEKTRLVDSKRLKEKN